MEPELGTLTIHYRGWRVKCSDNRFRICRITSCGVVEQISHEETGFLTSKISGDSLAEALPVVLTDRSKIKEVGFRARRAVIERFSEDRMIAAH